jgi:hypothetical protein
MQETMEKKGKRDKILILLEEVERRIRNALKENERETGGDQHGI